MWPTPGNDSSPYPCAHATVSPDDPVGWTGTIVVVIMLFGVVAVFGVLAYLTDRRERRTGRDDGSPGHG